MYERKFHWDTLRVELGQFASFLVTSNISVTKLFESLVNFGKNKSQKMFPEVTNSQNYFLPYLQPMLQVKCHFQR